MILNYIRRWAEKIGRSLVMRRRITVGGESARIYVSPGAQLKYLKLGGTGFDKDLIRIAERFIGEGSHVWDIGANCGVFGFAAGIKARKGKVLMVEADIWLAGLLRRTLAKGLNDYCEIRVLPVGVGAEAGFAEFLIAERGRASNSLSASGGRSQMGGVREVQLIPLTTLDFLFQRFGKPDFVKMDVEGAELMVLNGGGQMLKLARPLLYVEVDQANAHGVTDLLRREHYVLIDPSGGQKIGIATNNTFCIPEEKMGNFSDASIFDVA